MNAPGDVGPSPSAERAISHLAHELRNPLAVIAGYAELLVHRATEKTTRDAARRILEAVELLSTHVDDLLIVFAADAGALSVDPVAVELAAEVADAVRELERSVARTCSVEEDAVWPRVHADAEHLRKIFGNLLLNASRLTPDGGEIRVGVSVEDGFAAISVSDDGPGLGEQQLAALFERLSAFALPDRHEIRTSGLELYKTRRLVELQGGTIRAEHGRRGGTTVTFTLPLAEEEEAQ